jgi:hypothetical protein
MKLLIIQTSPFHTASTFLINAIYGLIPELNDKKIIGVWDDNFQDYFQEIICVKCHDINLDELTRKYNKNLKLVFICSERKELNLIIEEKYKKYANTVVFEFSELNETSINSTEQIVDNIHRKVRKMFDTVELDKIVLDKSTCIQRINAMNVRYEEIKHKPFTYIDDFYEIHGSHRNRPK